MDLNNFVTNNSFKKAIIIDDDLSLFNDENSLLPLFEKNETIKTILIEHYDLSEIKNLLIGDLRTVNSDCFDIIVDSLNVRKMLEMVEGFKKAGLDVLVKGNYSDEIDCSDSTIWVVDNILDSSTKNDKSHIKNAFHKFLENRNAGKNDIFLIYTNDTNNLCNYIGTESFVKNHHIVDDKDEINILYFNVMNKQETLDVNALETIFTKAIQADYFTKVKKIIDQSLKRVQKSLWTYEELKAQFYYNYSLEGITNDKNYYGIIISSLDNDYRASKQDNSFLTINKKLNELIDFDFNNNEDPLIKAKGRVLHELGQITGCEIIDQTVNELGYDVSYGDIFEIGSGFYLVVSQQCDITIREGKRKLDYFKLIPIKITDQSFKDIFGKMLVNIKQNEKFTKDQVDVLCEFLRDINSKNCLGLNMNNDDMEYVVDYFETKSIQETIPGLFKKDNCFVSLDIQEHKHELIVEDYILDVVVHNNNGSLSFDDKTEPVNVRYPSKDCINKAFARAKNVSKSLKQGGFEKMLQIRYHTDRNGWKRIGTISRLATDALYKKYIEHETRNAVLVFEKV